MAFVGSFYSCMNTFRSCVFVSTNPPVALHVYVFLTVFEQCFFPQATNHEKIINSLLLFFYFCVLPFFFPRAHYNTQQTRLSTCPNTYLYSLLVLPASRALEMGLGREQTAKGASTLFFILSPPFQILFLSVYPYVCVVCHCFKRWRRGLVRKDGRTDGWMDGRTDGRKEIVGAGMGGWEGLAVCCSCCDGKIKT